jgi:OmcA/MtrC family decaheme c-type cytochrome
MRLLKCVPALLAVGAMLTGCGSDGQDGQDGKDAVMTAGSATSLNVNIEHINIGAETTLEVLVKNENDLPVVGLKKFGFNLSGLEEGADGNSDEWITLATEGCPTHHSTQCGTLVDHGDGTYSYTLIKDITAVDKFKIDDHKTMRLVVRTGGESVGNTEVGYQNKVYDFRSSGEQPLYTKNVITDESCASCHDGMTKHGGKWTTEACAACHNSSHVGQDKIFPVLVHKLHSGVTSNPVGGCKSCHGKVKDLSEGDNWKTKPTAAACQSCHTKIDIRSGIGHMKFNDNRNCSACHAAESIDDVHNGMYEREGRDRSNLNIVLVDAKMVDTPEAKENQGKPGSFVQVTFDIQDKDGVSRQEQLDKVKYLIYAEFYINWGNQDQGLGNGDDIANGRGQILRVAGNKEPYPDYADDAILLKYEDGKSTYEIGSFDMKDDFSGDLNGMYGSISPRIWFCQSANGEVQDCDGETDWANGASGYNWLKFFNKDGIMKERPRKQIVSNQLCGSCHGTTKRDDGFVQMTLNCRSCHSAAGATYNTTCVSGNIDGMEKIMLKKLGARKRTDQTTTGNAAEECMACHNANTAPTQVLRDAHLKQGDKDYAVKLTMSHPDQKVWIHALHANNRSNQGGKDWVRNVEYSASLANCARCHTEDGFDAKDLAGRKPLSLDMDYMDTYGGIDDPVNGRYGVDAVADAYSSPTAAVCLSCHGKRAPEKGETKRQVLDHVVAHMEQNGAEFGVPIADYQGKESCVVCHDLNNLKEVHNQD